MSSSPWTVVGAGMYGAGADPKVGYTNGSDGATPSATWVYFQGLASNVASLY